MSETPDKSSVKAALKALRAERKALIQAATAKMKHQKKAIQAITDRLQEGAQTVPQIAAATGASTADTLWYVAALKKYGQVREAEKDGGYFKYALVEEAKGAAAD